MRYSFKSFIKKVTLSHLAVQAMRTRFEGREAGDSQGGGGSNEDRGGAGERGGVNKNPDNLKVIDTFI